MMEVGLNPKNQHLNRFSGAGNLGLTVRMSGRNSLPHEYIAACRELQCLINGLHLCIKFILLLSMKYPLPLLSLLLLLALPARAAEITGFYVEEGKAGEHVELQLSGKTHYKVFSVEASPPRVAVDLKETRMRGRAELPEDYRGTLVRGVRFGPHDPSTGRLVLDLAADARPRNIQAYVSDDSKDYWIEFDLPYPKGRPAAAPQPERAPEPPPERSAPPRAPEAESSGEPEEDRESSSEEAPALKAGHGKPVIVIDAGHGGQDPGTSGQRGTHEKDLTLRYASALAQALKRTGRYRVFLTRSDDRYLLLRERVRLARGAHGDLFISLHADSAPTRFARGLSVYTISETASDKESEALAAQENKADVIGGMDLSDASEDVAGILIDLAERETRAKSAKFADMAIKHLGREVGLLSNTHRFAGFAVLKAPDIPSVLIEIGFLTNAREESQLKSHAYEARVVRGLTQAIDEYYGRK
jgi:N-acetylmuramoyl-L-alanine amidase